MLRRRLNGRLPDLLILGLLFFLPLLMFWSQTVGGRTLLPTENLYQYEPFATYREVVKAPAVPYNHLVSDLVLENYQWKSFIRQQIAAREIPLWNPYQFSGIAFLAAGQHSAMYPFSILYYLLDLPAAYGWFTVVQLWLAGMFMYAFARGLGIGRSGAAVAGVTYQLSAFFVASAVFPMVIAAAVWLPLILLMIEYVIRHQPLFGRPAALPWVAVGAVALGCNILAGHVEITYYTLLVAGYYAAARLAYMAWTLWRIRQGALPSAARGQSPLKGLENPQHEVVEVPSAGDLNLRWTGIIREVGGRGAALIVMIALGAALGAVQFVPLFEAASHNFRAEGVTYEQIKNWAHPLRDLAQFAMPNFYGSPAQHTYFDVFSGQTVSLIDETITNAAGGRILYTDWGMKNYVEAALYVGVLPLILAGVALLDAWGLRRRRGIPYKLILALLALASLTFMFGLPTYRLLLLLPGINQLHSPFRWVFPLTLCAAALAGFGMDALEQHAGRWSRRIGMGILALGALIGVGLIGSRLAYDAVAPQVEWVFTSLAKAVDAFSDARMFYSYEFVNVGILALMLIGSGVVVAWAGRTAGTGRTPSRRGLRKYGWQALAVVLIAADLLIATAHFNPASDPALLDFTPPSIQWLMGQPDGARYVTIDEAGKPALFNANLTMRYGLRDIRGYDSIIPADYIQMMEQAYPQTQLEFNRVSPIFADQMDQIDWTQLTALNVRYAITHKGAALPDSFLIQHGGRSFTPVERKPVYSDEAVDIYDLYTIGSAYILMPSADAQPSINDFSGFPVTTGGDTGRERVLYANLYADRNSWLVVSEAYDPGWRAFVRPRDGSDDTEQALPVERVMTDLIGIHLSPEVLRETFDGVDLNAADQAALDARQVTVRLVYSPASFQIGLFASFIGGVLVVLLVGGWLWRRLVGEREHEGAARVARNSVAPIFLNLFNRGIDMAFALVMLRILGPTDAGWYFYAGVIFVWFDIFTNFGLNLYLTREVSRDRSKARMLFLNTSALRILLAAAGVPLLIGFLAARQGIADPPLTPSVILAISILYVGLLPNSLSTGFTALFYAFERAELPAAVATAATVNKVILGLIALVLGWGFVGLAGVSIVSNFLTLAILAWYGRGMIAGHGASTKTQGGKDAKETNARVIQPALMRGMMRESAPLLLNHFLATIFFQIDVVIIEALRGATMVGQYSVSYKWLTALNVIPSFFTQALLPRMSRQAHEDRAALRRDYVFAIKLLFSLALPIAVFFTFSAYFWAGFLGGSQYLPDGAIATQLMIWSIPIGWMNSLTQYTLIALDLHKRIGRAFVAGVVFNIVANLIFVPDYGYQAAAIITIFSEGVLFVGFALLLRQGLKGMGINWLAVVWRPLVSAALMFLVMWIGYGTMPAVALVAGSALYAGTLLALGTFERHEFDLLIPLLPGRMSRLVRAQMP